MANAQGFLYAYSVTLDAATGAITLDPRNPKGGITVTDNGTDNTAVLGDISGDGV